MNKQQKKLRGSVQKIIPPLLSSDPEKAQINVDDAEELYCEIRIENILTDQDGKETSLKEGTEVNIILEVDSDATPQGSPDDGREMKQR